MICKLTFRALTGGAIPTRNPLSLPISFTLLRSLSLMAAALTFAVSTFAQSTERVLHNFSTKGAGGSLISDSHGNLYGTTGGFRKQYGTVFELRHLKSGRWTYKLLYRFTGGTDGAYPRPGLVFDTAGNLYGTTLVGGDNPCDWTTPRTCGIVFQLTPTPKGQWTEKVAYSFPGSGGAAIPSTGLISDSSGNLYGATTIGGTHFFDGTVFTLTKQPDGTWARQQLYAFTSGNTFGMSAQGLLTMDSAGNLYGATRFGGNGANCSDVSNGCGTVFKLSPIPSGSWTYSLLHSFCSRADCSDGGYPNGVVPDDQGNLYGTTSSGAVEFTDGGTAFELSPNGDGSWTFNLLYSFCSLPICEDGSRPSGAPIRDGAGNLYGPTILGGDSLHNGGTVFKLSPGNNGAWNFQSLYAFCPVQGCVDGFEPVGQLTLDSAGNVYGTTPVGGKGLGVLFQIGP